MPTSREIVSNSALSGDEIKTLLRADFERLLANDSLLSHYMAYGRISWDITITKHVDNALARTQDTSISSRLQSGVGAVETHPLSNPSPSSVLASGTLHRDITSPNAERIRNGIPVPVLVSQQDGTKVEQMVTYPMSSEVGEGQVTISEK